MNTIMARGQSECKPEQVGVDIRPCEKTNGERERWYQSSRRRKL